MCNYLLQEWMCPICAVVHVLLSIEAEAEVSGFFRNGNGPVILHSVACHGSERRLLDCEGEIRTVPSCSRAAGVTCQPGICI